MSVKRKFINLPLLLLTGGTGLKINILSGIAGFDEDNLSKLTLDVLTKFDSSSIKLAGMKKVGLHFNSPQTISELNFT